MKSVIDRMVAFCNAILYVVLSYIDVNVYEKQENLEFSAKYCLCVA